MKDLNKISEELFNKIRGRFKDVTIGDENGDVTNQPTEARFFDFPFKANNKSLGAISVNVTESELTVIYSTELVTNEDELTKNSWYDFLKELRQFARKRLLNFDTRNINKSNLNKRDYKFLANRSGDNNMNESKLYGTSRISYQNIGEARIMIKHTESVNQESATGRTQKIGKIYIESPEGERFKYPYKHLSGARAMARHVAEGGNAYDDFGKHIVGLSEEMSKLRKFKTYMGRSAVMAESLAGYVDIVKERIATVKKTIESLQKPAYYKEAFEAFNPPVLEDVPSDVAENWIDELTIKQFNEELQDIFPYIYNLVKEGTKAQELGPDDLDESGLQYYTGVKKHGKEYMKKAAQAGREGASQEELGRLKDKYSKAEKKTKEELELEAAFEETMGQFAEAKDCDDCGCSPCECDTQDEGNAYAKAVRQAKMNGKKKGDEIDGPDGEKITLEKEKTPIGEFILSYYDRETGEFPKGETAVLTMVEKDYGEQFIEPAKAFIEKIQHTFDEYQMRTQPQQLDTQEYDRMRELAGLR